MNVIYYLFCLTCMMCETFSLMFGMGGLDLNPLRCMWKRDYYCPHEDVRYHLYTPRVRSGIEVDIMKPVTFKKAGYIPEHETCLVIHGFNGTQKSKHIRYLIDAYVSRDFNVIAIDWEAVSAYPCYLSSLSNTRLVAQCSAQLYSFVTYLGTQSKNIVCVGHSLGAHICGMISNHLTKKQYKIIVVQIIHTNAGVLGQEAATGSIDFCINGGRNQPFCHGLPLRRARCSHFLSVCFLANSMFKHKKWVGVPCPRGCVSNNRFPFFLSNLHGTDANGVHQIPMREYKIGQDTPDDHTGIYCIKVDHAKNCPFQ
uniref:CSON008436 protein n=1 Tax=Culicoides sonorensis TaxID=179676 RepID=A0A336LN77_CULSO